MKVLNLQLRAAATASKAGSRRRTISRPSSPRGLVECPLCGDTAITQAAERAAPEPRHARRAARKPPPASWSAAADALQARWMRAVREVMAKTEDVGERFAEEARRIHYGEAEERGIRGQATPEQDRRAARRGHRRDAAADSGSAQGAAAVAASRSGRRWRLRPLNCSAASRA